MNFKSLSIAASAAILSVSLMTGCGGSDSSTPPEEPVVAKPKSITGTASAIGNLSGVTVRGLDANGNPLTDCINTGVTGTYALSCSEMPTFVKVSPTNVKGTDLSFNNVLDTEGIIDDEDFIGDFYAIVNGESVNITPLSYLQYKTDNKLEDITDVTNPKDIFVVVTVANTLTEAGFNTDEAYTIIAKSIDENTTIVRMKKGFKLNTGALDEQKQKASDRGEAITVDTSSLESATNKLAEAAENAKDAAIRKAVAVVAKKIKALVKTARETGGTVPDVTEMTKAESIALIAIAISEAGNSVNLKELSESIPDDGIIDAAAINAAAINAVSTHANETPCNDNDATTENDVYTNGVCAGTTIVVEPTTPDDNNNGSVTPPVINNPAIEIKSISFGDEKVELNNNIFSSDITTSESDPMDFYDITIDGSVLNYTDKTDLDVSISIVNTESQSVSMDITGGYIENDTITFPVGTNVSVTQSGIQSLGSIIGISSETSTLEASGSTTNDLENVDLSFNLKTVLNTLPGNSDIDEAVSELNSFLSQKGTYSVSLKVTTLSDITGT
ncbi:MAG: hypothetical protein U9Q30_00020, partial [Campylobacterota bacterium]|nr:hypothetical protein [Campylobacterota bacterium]